MPNLTLSGDYRDFDEAEVSLGIKMRNFTPVAVINGSGKIALNAVERVDVDQRTVSYFVEIEIVEGSDEAKGVTLVDIDEARRVSLALQRLKLSNPTMTRFSSFQATFVGEDGLRISTFSDDRGKIVFAFTSDGATAYLAQLNRVDEVILGISKTVSYIEAHGFTID